MSSASIAAIVMGILIAITGGFAIWYSRKLKADELRESKGSSFKPVSSKTFMKNDKPGEVTVKDSREIVKDIEDIDSGIITTDHGKRYVAAITCRGVDLFNESSVGQNSIMQGYRQFINIITDPTTLRIYSRAMDIDSLMEKYKKEYEICFFQYEMLSKELEKFQQRNGTIQESGELKRRKRVLEQRLNHLSDQMGAMQYYSDTNVVLELEQEYIFDWRYDSAQSKVPLTKGEVARRAGAEISAIAKRKISALAASGVRARMCTQSEMVDACRRNSKPISAELFKQKHVENSAYDEDIVESDSDNYFHSAIVFETENGIQKEITNKMKELSTAPELLKEIKNENNRIVALFGSGGTAGEEEVNVGQDKE